MMPVPHVRPSVRGTKKMGKAQPLLLLRRAGKAFETCRFRPTYARANLGHPSCSWARSTPVHSGDQWPGSLPRASARRWRRCEGRSASQAENLGQLTQTKRAQSRPRNVSEPGADLMIHARMRLHQIRQSNAILQQLPKLVRLQSVHGRFMAILGECLLQSESLYRTHGQPDERTQ